MVYIADWFQLCRLNCKLYRCIEQTPCSFKHSLSCFTSCRRKW